jgi:hypothetical protein
MVNWVHTSRSMYLSMHFYVLAGWVSLSRSKYYTESLSVKSNEIYF